MELIAYAQLSSRPGGGIVLLAHRLLRVLVLDVNVQKGLNDGCSFKVQNNMFMAAGALLGLIAAAVCYRGFIEPSAGYTSLFIAALTVFSGVAGKLLSVRQAGRRLKGYLGILCQEGDAERFIKEFAPIVEHTPAHTAEYADGVHRLACVWEALGEYGRGLALLEMLKPEKFKLYRLASCAVVENQKMRLRTLPPVTVFRFHRRKYIRKDGKPENGLDMGKAVVK